MELLPPGPTQPEPAEQMRTEQMPPELTEQMPLELVEPMPTEPMPTEPTPTEPTPTEPMLMGQMQTEQMPMELMLMEPTLEPTLLEEMQMQPRAAARLEEMRLEATPTLPRVVARPMPQLEARLEALVVPEVLEVLNFIYS